MEEAALVPDSTAPKTIVLSSGRADEQPASPDVPADEATNRFGSSWMSPFRIAVAVVLVVAAVIAWDGTRASAAS